MVLQNPRVDMAVFEVARGGILREGLGYGRNDVGVVLNVTGDHLGLREVETIEQLAGVKQVVIEAVPKSGWAVLNADDPLVLEMRRHCSGQVILFSMQEKHELVDRWIRRGRKAVVLERGPLGELMVLKEGRRSSPIAYVHMLPATFDGRARMMVQNAMAAAAAAHAAGAHLHDIRQGLRSFTTSIYQAPGRLNVFELQGMKVVLDYAHNAAGLEQLGDFVDHLTSDGAIRERPGEAARAANLVVGVVATAGDRRDEDMRELGRVAAKHFNVVIVREDRNPRGRPRGETAELVVEGVREAMSAGRARTGTVEIVLDEMEAARRALDRGRPGDTIVLCVDYATEVYKELEKRRGTATPAALRASEGGLIEAVGGDVDLIDLTNGRP
jgi:cyanophycin synthetase